VIRQAKDRPITRMCARHASCGDYGDGIRGICRVAAANSGSLTLPAVVPFGLRRWASTDVGSDDGSGTGCILVLRRPRCRCSRRRRRRCQGPNFWRTSTPVRAPCRSPVAALKRRADGPTIMHPRRTVSKPTACGGHFRSTAPRRDRCCVCVVPSSPPG
jgi:hypothetical protein